MKERIAKKLEQLTESLKAHGEEGAAGMIKESFFQEFKDYWFGSFKELKRGNRGPEVRKVQEALVGKGFPLPRHGVDGIFGPETEASVKNFQQANSLNMDGIVNKDTASKLEVNVTPSAATQEVAPPVAAEAPMTQFSREVYEPFSGKARKLFRRAALIAGVPQAWADSDSLHSLLEKESLGFVGIPNYTYGKRAADSRYWGQIHNELKAGTKTTDSSATGLGQLLLRNVDKYYPSGRNGIGVAEEEAVGMLRYIKDRYNSPEEAWSKYGSAEKTDPDTGAVFTEGY